MRILHVQHVVSCPGDLWRIRFFLASVTISTRVTSALLVPSSETSAAVLVVISIIQAVSG